MGAGEMNDKAIEAAYDAHELATDDGFNLMEAMRAAIAAYERALCEDRACSECGTPARRIFLLGHTAGCVKGRVPPLKIEDDDPDAEENEK